MIQRCAIISISLVIGVGFLLWAGPAVASCHCVATVYNTGTQTGTGSTCAAAHTSLETILNNTAEANCETLYGDNSAGLCAYSETVGSCQACSPGQMQSGSAQYQCEFCLCIGPKCGGGGPM